MTLLRSYSFIAASWLTCLDFLHEAKQTRMIIPANRMTIAYLLVFTHYARLIVGLLTRLGCRRRAVARLPAYGDEQRGNK